MFFQEQKNVVGRCQNEGAVGDELVGTFAVPACDVSGYGGDVSPCFTGKSGCDDEDCSGTAICLETGEDCTNGLDDDGDELGVDGAQLEVRPRHGGAERWHARAGDDATRALVLRLGDEGVHRRGGGVGSGSATLSSPQVAFGAIFVAAALEIPELQLGESWQGGLAAAIADAQTRIGFRALLDWSSVQTYSLT